MWCAAQDLFWSTSVHRLLQSLLGIPQPAYRHHRLILDDAGQKLSKSTKATGLRELRGSGATPADIRELVGFRSSLGVDPKAIVTPAPWHAMLSQGRVHGDHGGKTARTAYNTAGQKAAEEEARLRCRGEAARQRRKPRALAPGMVEAALAAFAHEVRTPLTGILAISNLLATSDLDERERRWVDTIKAGAEHLASLATLFVDAARSKGPGSRCAQDLFDLRTLARNAGDSLAGRAAAKGLQSAVEISEKLPAFVVGDPVRLRAALENLIDNAVKFTEQGSVTLDGHRRCAARKGKVGVAFAVSDSGIGLTLGRGQAAVPPVLAGQCLDRLALRRRRPWAVVGQATRARHGRRHHRHPTPRRRHHLYARCRAVAGQGAGIGRRQGPTASVGWARRGRCACSASRTIRSAASCSTPS